MHVEPPLCRACAVPVPVLICQNGNRGRPPAGDMGIERGRSPKGGNARARRGALACSCRLYVFRCLKLRAHARNICEAVWASSTLTSRSRRMVLHVQAWLTDIKPRAHPCEMWNILSNEVVYMAVCTVTSISVCLWLPSVSMCVC